MGIQIETSRLILREMEESDLQAFFEMDSNPLVHQYLGNQPLQEMNQSMDIIHFVQQQYIDNGMGRWTILLKESGEYLGWSGLKLLTEETNSMINIVDVGYRLSPVHWGKGYATESSLAALEYGFEHLHLSKIYASAHRENKASQHVLKKIGMQISGEYDWNEHPCYWFEQDIDQWKQHKKNLTNNEFIKNIQHD